MSLHETRGVCSGPVPSPPCGVTPVSSRHCPWLVVGRVGGERVPEQGRALCGMPGPRGACAMLASLWQQAFLWVCGFKGQGPVSPVKPQRALSKTFRIEELEAQAS